MGYVVIAAGSSSGSIPVAWLQSLSGMRTGLTIGEFATVTHLSVRTLRRYHQSGLLAPAAVDPFTG